MMRARRTEPLLASILSMRCANDDDPPCVPRLSSASQRTARRAAASYPLATMIMMTTRALFSLCLFWEPKAPWDNPVGTTGH